MQIAGTSLETALRNAISGGYVAEMSGQTYTVTQPPRPVPCTPEVVKVLLLK